MPVAPFDTFSNVKLEPAIEPELAIWDTVPMAPSLTVARGTVLGQVTATGAFRPYATGNSDGSQVARAIAQYDFTTDGAGNVVMGHEKVGQTRRVAPVWIGGYFRSEDLVGLDAGAVSALGKIIKGDNTTGLLRVS